MYEGEIMTAKRYEKLLPGPEEPLHSVAGSSPMSVKSDLEWHTKPPAIVKSNSDPLTPDATVDLGRIVKQEPPTPKALTFALRNFFKSFKASDTEDEEEDDIIPP